MTTDQIETNADIGGISAPDLNLKILLREKVCPKFFHDVGYTSWRRKVAVVATVIGVQVITAPTDFEMIESIVIDGQGTPLQYIGENPESVMAAESAVGNAIPTGYYLSSSTSPGGQDRIKWQAPSSVAANARIAYYNFVPFTDYTTSVDIDKYVPKVYQWALVEGLKMEIMFHRFGIGDPRYISAEREYGQFVERATDNKERARRNHPVFMR